MFFLPGWYFHTGLRAQFSALPFAFSMLLYTIAPKAQGGFFSFSHFCWIFVDFSANHPLAC